MKRVTVVSEPPASSEPVTIRDVARKARVSLSSVSRVLTEHPDVSRTMKQRVLKATATLGYEPHFIAQSLRRGVTHTLGFLIGDISNPVFADMIRGAEDHARSKGYAGCAERSRCISARIPRVQCPVERTVPGSSVLNRGRSTPTRA